MCAVIGLGFVTCGIPYVGVALLVLGLASTGCAYGAGFMVNYNDIAGTYAGKHDFNRFIIFTILLIIKIYFKGLTFGIANTFGTVPGQNFSYYFT